MSNAHAEPRTVSYLKALGAPLDRATIRRDLLREPDWSPEVRSLPMLDRQMRIASLSDAFFPVPAQCRLAESIQNMLRAGYENRSVDLDGVTKLPVIENSHHRSYNYQAIDIPSAPDNGDLSASLIGIPGMGKSTAIRRALALFDRPDRRIDHKALKLSPQLMSLTISCPVIPTVKGFCLAFFEALALAVKDPHAQVFGHPTRDIDSMPESVKRLAKNHAIGLLVVDDIQRLESVRNGQGNRILGILHEIASEAGVPVMLVGTNAAADVLCHDARTALRCVGEGSEVWDRLPRGQAWDAFISKLWQFQWTSNETPLTPELSDLFYDRCQGIVSLAVKLYQRVQSAVIRQADVFKEIACSGEDALIKREIITPVFVEAVCDRLFGPVQSLLDALRSGDPAKLQGFPDLRPLPQQAKRMQQEADAEKEREQAADGEESADAGPAGNDNPDETDDQIAEKIKTRERVAAEMLAMAHQIFSEAGCDQDEIDKHLCEMRDVLGDKLHEQKRKFFQEIDARLKARSAKFRRADDPAVDFDERKYEAEDLRGLLKRGVDVRAALREAKIDGRRGLLMVA